MFKGKQIKFLEQETTRLGMQSENQNKELKSIGAKLEDLEKLMESTKESLNQLSASRFDSISKEIQEFNEKVEGSMNSLGKLQQDMGELNLVNQTLSELKHSFDELKDKSNTNVKSIEELRSNSLGNTSTIDTMSTDLQNLIISSKTDLAKLQAEFSETQDVVQSIKTELLEERQKVMEGKETIMKQEVTINEKTSQLEKLEKELKESRALIGKLDAQKDGLEKELLELRANKDQQYRDLTKLQADFASYKKTNEGEFAFNAAVKRLLEQSTEGKVMLELFKKSPQSIDSIADNIQVANVILKTLNTLQDINAIKVDSETRMVSL